jgi:putative transcriptional regulator
MMTNAWNGSDLSGSLLVAMPSMRDERFERTVIYVCVHNADGAMGLVINRTMDELTLEGLLRQLDLEPDHPIDEPIHFGGPVETSRGFVLHTPDYVHDATLVIDDDFALTATVEVLKAIAKGEGPRRAVMALGYAGWAPGQLDAEIQANGWLSVPADAEIVFGRDNDVKWAKALAKLGIDPALLSGEAGRA